MINFKNNNIPVASNLISDVIPSVVNFGFGPGSHSYHSAICILKISYRFDIQNYQLRMCFHLS